MAIETNYKVCPINVQPSNAESADARMVSGKPGMAHIGGLTSEQVEKLFNVKPDYLLGASRSPVNADGTYKQCTFLNVAEGRK